MKIRIVVLAGALAVFASFAAPSVHAQTGNELFQQALVKEQAEGDLREAIRLYTRIVTDFLVDRPLVARALMRIGAAYDKLGDAAARTAYERIVAEYADQREALRVAQERLRVLDPDGQLAAALPPGAEPTFKFLLDLPPYARGSSRPARVDFSPDGTRLVAVLAKPSEGGAGLFISDAAGAGPFLVLEDWQLLGYQTPRWSPDGHHILFVGRPRPYDGEFGLYVWEVDGGEPWLIAPQQHSDQQLSPIWTPSGNVTFIAGARSDDRLVTVDLAGNAVRDLTLHSQENSALEPFDAYSLMGYSPDGRWVAFHSRLGDPEADSGTRGALWVTPAGGGRVRHVVDLAGVPGSAQMTWDLDGRAFYLVGLGGTEFANIYRVEFDPRTGEALGEPQAVTSYRGVRVQSHKMLTDGSLAYVVTNRSSLVEVADDASRPMDTRTVARGSGAQMSSDGRFVYYVGQGHGREGIFEVPFAGGEPRRVTSIVPAHGGGSSGHLEFSAFQLSPNGTAITFHTHLGDEPGMFVLPVSGGEPRLVARDGRWHGPPVWSPDGSRLAYVKGGDIYTVAAEGGVPKKIAGGQEWWWLLQWSPDGKYLAAFSYPDGEDGGESVFVVPSEGGELRRLTGPEESGGEGLSWHPDSQRLSYHSYRPDGSRIAYLDGRPTTVLVQDPDRYEYIGAWTPDGKTLVYYSQRRTDATGSVWAYDEATGRTTEFFTDQEHALPSWSRDGSRFAVDRYFQTHQIWLMENFR